MKVSSRLNVGSKWSWGKSKTFGKKTINLNKQLNHQNNVKLKAYCIKQKVIGYNPPVYQNNHQKAEWMPHQNQTKMQNIRSRKMKTSEGTRLHFKKLIKNPNPKLWVNSVKLAWRKKVMPDFNNKHQTTTFKHGQEYPPKESEVSSETRNWNPSTLHH